MKIFISGVGGSGAFYLAKYYIYLGNEVYGSDCKSNARIESLNIPDKIVITSDATSFIKSHGDFDLYIYSSAFDKTHPERVYFASQNVETYEVGELTDKLINDCLTGQLSEKQRYCAIKSELLPLVAIDWSAKKYIAVTGTDGKTTTVSMIYHILNKCGLKVAMISTVGMFVSGSDEVIDTGFHTTTPSAQELYKLLTSKQLADVEVVILETTSHSLAMGRVAFSRFDAVAVTNVTSEHLDYHKTWDNYFNAKARLIKEHVKRDGVVVLNVHDEKSYSRLVEICNQKNLKFVTNDGISDNIKLNPKINTWYNRDNASLAKLICQNILQKNLSDDVLADFKGISGRMEYLQDEPFAVIVDFAHTENALKLVLTNLRNKVNEGRLHIVFGCAGMRDRTKRSPMGQVAFNIADNIYICPEDPRTEHLADIDSEILSGMGLKLDDGKQSGDVRTFCVEEKVVKVYLNESVDARRQAIFDALNDAKEGDIVVVCGKGHEKSLCFGSTEFAWSDQETIKQLL